MARQRIKLISALLALLMLVSPLSSQAMQPAESPDRSSHCQDLTTDAQFFQSAISDHAPCTMEDCLDNCSSSMHCSGQAPMILSLLDIDTHIKERGLAIGPISDSHPFIHPSGLYRPPRI